MNLAVLASTNGTDLQAIIEEMRTGKMLGVDLVCVISNKKDCGALEKAHNAKIEAIYINPEKLEREEYDQKIAEVLDKKNIDLVAMIGYMRFVSPWFVKKYRNRIMNIHPSLLPAFAGRASTIHAEILEHGCKISGATIHFVDEGADTGPIIMQESVKIEKNETPDSLRKKVQNLEKKMYPEAIRLFAEKKLKVENNRKVKVN
jgi:phosphoribosylglycinamide formyltransferase-1